MSIDQEQWVARLNGLGLKPSLSDKSFSTEALDVSCPQLPGIKARFLVYEEGNQNRFSPGIYLNIGILPQGLAIPSIRDALSEFAIQTLIDPKDEPQTTRRLGSGITFDLVGTTVTGSTMLRLRSVSPEQLGNLGQLVESGDYSMRVTLTEGGKIPPSHDL